MYEKHPLMTKEKNKEEKDGMTYFCSGLELALESWDSNYPLC